MPNHLQDRTSDMHKGRSSTDVLNWKSALIIGVLVMVIVAILFLT